MSGATQISSKDEHKIELSGTHEAAKNDLEGISGFRVALPQILASTAKNLILLDLGMSLAFPTIVIPALRSAQEGLKFTQEQASWYGSIAYICQPAGSLVSGLMFEPLGRKRAMLLVNIPHFIAWLMLHFATTTAELYTAGVIMGLGIGFMEAPILTYVGEICQPKWRGVLTSYAGLFVTVGYTVVFLSGTITDWQTSAALCSLVPALAILVISQVPESPIWLMSKGRLAEAEKSLCWLRGWVSPNLIQQELTQMRQHNYKPDVNPIKTISESFRSIPEDRNVGSSNSNIQNTHDQVQSKATLGFKKVLKFFYLDELARRQTFQPLLLVMLLFIFHHTSGVTSTRPFMVEIFKEMGSPIDSYLTTVISSLIGLIGNIICMTVVRKIGKRSLSLYTLSASGIVNFILCGYIFFIGSSGSEQYVPVVLYLCLCFMWNCGLGQLPWMLISEVFPMKGRGLASGVAAAGSYILAFIVTKTYYNLHETLTLGGVFGVYAFCCILGFISLYVFLPETEGKTLQDIESILESKFQKIRRKLNKIV